MSMVIGVVIGALTGVLSGFGVGGGTLLLLWMTAVQGMGQAQAGGVNLLYFIACALPASIGHIKNGLIEKRAVFWCVVLGAPACIAGAFLAAGMDTELLKRLFGGFILGKLLDSLIIGIICFFCMKLMKLPYVLLISVIIGVTNIIPFFQPVIIKIFLNISHIVCS